MKHFPGRPSAERVPDTPGGLLLINVRDMEGWISLHRKIQEHWIWENPVYLKGWIAILMHVNHADTKVLINSQLVDCRRGQSLLSVDNWCDILGKRWTRQKVRTFFELLKKDSMINTENLRKTTRLTVCNYDKYQNWQPSNNHHATITQPSNNPQITTNNKDLIKINNGNNFFSEKVNFEFEKFLKNEDFNKRPVSEERQKALIEKLNSIAPNDDDYQVAVIRQAIAGNYSDFRPIADYQKTDSGKILAPSREEFTAYFLENGQTSELAGKVYDSCAYHHEWKNKAGFSFIETWQEVVKKHFVKTV